MPAAFQGRLQSCALNPAASAAAACSSDLPGGCVGLAADATSPRTAGACRALPQLGIFPNISWELWEGERGELQQVLVGSGCPRLSPCVCVVLGGVVWIRPVTRQLPTVHAGGFGRGGGTGHVCPSPVHPGCGGAGRDRAGSWDGSEGGGREGSHPRETRVRTSSSAWASACSRPGCR